ncbi:MAG TPA: HAMP domain-containing protein, partial [Pseudonocardiaceae bacterium]|nr:HAMP domain-containing protein [Pseudonocardiaceae bacterium]
MSTTEQTPETGGEKIERPRRISLSARVTLLAAICVAGAVALVSLGAYFTVGHSLYQQAQDNLLSEAIAAAESSHNNDFTGGVTFTPPSDNSFSNVRISLIDENGKQAQLKNIDHSAYTLTVPNSLIGAPEKGVAKQNDVPSDQLVRSERVEGDYAVVSVALPTAQGTALVVAKSLDAEKSILGRLSLVLFLISGAGIVVAALAGTAVATGGLRPVARLTAATERVATGDLQPLPVTGDDELARLTTSFNAMLGALAESQEQQRRLVADAGHELRTPLTSLRTNLELLIAASKPDTPTLSPQDTAELHADLRGQLDELTTL